MRHFIAILSQATKTWFSYYSVCSENIQTILCSEYVSRLLNIYFHSLINSNFFSREVNIHQVNSLCKVEHRFPVGNLDPCSGCVAQAPCTCTIPTYGTFAFLCLFCPRFILCLELFGHRLVIHIPTRTISTHPKRPTSKSIRNMSVTTTTC